LLIPALKTPGYSQSTLRVEKLRRFRGCFVETPGYTKSTLRVGEQKTFRRLTQNTKSRKTVAHRGYKLGGGYITV